jgi:hypothetical protein
MQFPTEQAAPSIPTETVVAINSLNLNRTFTVRRKAAKRSERWYQNTAAQLSVPARKKPRLEERPCTDTVAASTLHRSSHHVNTTNSTSTTSTSAPAPPTDTANASTLDALDPSIDRANGRTGKWEEDEDINLRNAVQMHAGKDWAAIAKLVPRRTNLQCRHRWHGFLKPSIDQAN